jgi:high-affinity Fe2+/Pb2+ permease
MIRASLYLIAAGAVWLTEGFVFSRFLRFSGWQTALMALVYVGLFLIAAWYLARFARRYRDPVDGLAVWRLISLAPMIALLVGSFASLPILLLVAALGRLT